MNSFPDALLGIDTAVISDHLSLYEYLSQAIPLSKNFVASRCVVLFATMLNAHEQQKRTSMQCNVFMCT